MGRGFQGYKRIIVDDVANGMRNVSDYHVQYPLTGQLAENRSCPLSANDLECDALPITQSAHVWDLWRDGVLQQTVSNTSTDFSTYVLEHTRQKTAIGYRRNLQRRRTTAPSSSHSAGTGAVQPVTVSTSWTHQTISEQTFDTNSCQTSSRETYTEPAGANQNVVGNHYRLQPRRHRILVDLSGEQSAGTYESGHRTFVGLRNH